MNKVFYTELAYVFGLLILALGTAFMERAAFGMSMVVAPAYLVYLKISEIYSWFTFGMAEYCFQAVLILLISIVLLRFKVTYIFSFATAFIYGNILDIFMKLIGLIPEGGSVQRLFFFVVGMLCCSCGVSLFFHTYITPEAYELFVKELADKTGKDIHIIKTIYDCCSCFTAIIMSFAFYGFMRFEGVKLGTIICALLNGWIIGRFSMLFDKYFMFKDGLNIRGVFEK